MTAVEWIEQELRRNENIRWRGANIEDILNQAKEMEQEQMIKFAEFVASYPDKNKNAYGERLHAKSKYDGAERTVDLLEQYYNETYGNEIGSSLEWNGEVTQGYNLKPKYTPGKGISFYMEKEISDEEIEKAAAHHEPMVTRRAWISACKWYRERLKLRQ